MDWNTAKRGFTALVISLLVLSPVVPFFSFTQPASAGTATISKTGEITSSNSRGVYLDNKNDILYIADYSDGLTIMNVSDPSNPSQIANLAASSFPGNPSDVQKVGDYVYVSDFSGNITSVDVSNLSNPAVVESINHPTNPADNIYSFEITSDGGTIIAPAYGDGRLDSISINSGSMSYLDSIQTDTDAVLFNVALDGGTAYYGAHNSNGGEAYSVDISDPSGMVNLSSVTYSSSSSDTQGIAAKDGYVYLSTAVKELHVIDATTPDSMSYVTQKSPSYSGDFGIEIKGSHLFQTVQSGTTSYGFYVWDISNPSSPSADDYILDSNMGGAWGIATNQKTAYMSSMGNVGVYDTGLPEVKSKYSVSGTVTDQSGNSIDGATVEITDTSDGSAVTTTTTDSTGAWSTSLANGTYNVTVKKRLYSSVTTEITVDGGPVSGVNQTIAYNGVLDDFEDGDLSGWSNTGSASISSIAYDSNHSMKLSGSTDPSLDFTNDTYPSLSYRVKIDADSTDNEFFNWRNTGNKDAIATKVQRNSTTGELEFWVYDGSWVQYGNSTDTSAHVRIEASNINYSSDTFDIAAYINGSKVGERTGSAFANPSDKIGKATIGAPDSTTVNYFYDDVWADRTIVSTGGASGGGVSARVVTCPAANPDCQNPSGAPDGTVVEIYGVDRSQISPGKLESVTERAEEIRSNLRSWNTSELGWNPNRALTGSSGDYAEASGNYVAIHRKSEWGLTQWSDEPKLGNPKLVAPADKSFIVSIWDPEKTGWPQDGVNDDLTGKTQNGTIVFEQLDMSGGSAETFTVQTDGVYDVGGLGGKHHYAEVSLPRGFYRVSAKGSPFSMVISVGNPADARKVVTSDLRNEKDKLTNRASEIKDLMDQKKVVQITTTTYTKNGSAGHFNASVPSGVEVVTVQAYTPTVDKYKIADPANASIQDMREIASLDSYNGSIIYTPRAKELAVPSSGNTVRAIEAGSSPFMDPSRFQNKTEWLKDLFANASINPANYLESLDGKSKEELKELRNQLASLKNQNSAIRGRYQELLDQYGESQNETEQLKNEIKALNQAVNELEGELKAEQTESTYENGTISATIPFNGELDPSAVAVTANYVSIGETHTVPEKYVSVDKRAGRGDQVIIEDYPVVNNSSLITFSVAVSGEDGEGVGEVKVPVRNPNFQGKFLNLESVSVSTIQPGPTEQVTMTVPQPSEGAQIQNVTATVSGPNGPVNVTTTDKPRSLAFTTNGPGSYFVQVDIQDTENNTWTERFTLHAIGTNTENPASIMAVEGYTGEFAVAGAGLNGGAVEVDANTMTVSAIASADSVPSRVHVHTEGLSADYENTHVRLLKQSSGEPVQINRHATVVLHTAKLPENAILYRNDGTPIGHGEETKGGVWRNTENGTTIRTWTDANGEVTVETIKNPTWIDRGLYWARTNSPVDLPSLFTVPAPTVPFQIPDFNLVLTVQVQPLALADTADAASAALADGPTSGLSGGVPA